MPKSKRANSDKKNAPQVDQKKGEMPMKKRGKGKKNPMSSQMRKMLKDMPS